MSYARSRSFIGEGTRCLSAEGRPDWSKLCTYAALGTAVACISACGKTQRDDGARQFPTYEARAPGSDAAPTNDASFQFLNEDGPTRFRNFQVLFGQAGKQCSAVTSATFEGGVDGTDEWRVNCADSGSWQLWFKPEGGPPEFDHCATAKCEVTDVNSST